MIDESPTLTRAAAPPAPTPQEAPNLSPLDAPIPSAAQGAQARHDQADEEHLVRLFADLLSERAAREAEELALRRASTPDSALSPALRASSEAQRRSVVNGPTATDVFMATALMGAGLVGSAWATLPLLP